MTTQTKSRTQTIPRTNGLATGAGRRLAPLLLALALAPAALAHHDLEEHAGSQLPAGGRHRHERGAYDRHDHYHAHAYHDVKPHQHTYTHTHWHTHVLEDDTVIHHSHPHSHTYWHYGPDETEEERVTRVLEDKESAPPHEESETPSSGTRFVEPRD